VIRYNRSTIYDFQLPVSRMRGNYFPNSALRRAGGRGRLNLWLIPNHAGNDLFLRYGSRSSRAPRQVVSKNGYVRTMAV
jgi:hypothetical protein